MESRDVLKTLYTFKEAITQDIDNVTEKYVSELGPYDHGIYITDHAIVRYLERVVGYTYPPHLTDTSKLELCNFSIESIRKEMLSIEEDRFILNKQLQFFRKDGYGLVIKNLAVITVIVL